MIKYIGIQQNTLFFMLAKKRTIKIKKEDSKQGSVKSLKKLAWESKQSSRSLSEQVHKHPKHRKPKYKKGWEEDAL